MCQACPINSCQYYQYCSHVGWLNDLAIMVLVHLHSDKKKVDMTKRMPIKVVLGVYPRRPDFPLRIQKHLRERSLLIGTGGGAEEF